MPIAATTQSVAAVVSPRTEKPCRMIAPAPRKPIPVTTCAAMRVGSARTMLLPPARNSWKPYAETIVNRAEPSETRRCVLTPASRSRSSRSNPTIPPSPHANASRTSASQPLSVGTLLRRCIDGLPLHGRELLDPGRCEVEQLVEARPLERHLLRRRLHLDEASVARHDDVDVHVRVRVLRVVEVEQCHAFDDPDRDGGDRAGQRLREPEPVECAHRGDVRAGDRGAARTAVGLQHVTVEIDGPLPERLEVDDAAEGAADQPLDLDRPPALPAARSLAIRAVA